MKFSFADIEDFEDHINRSIAGYGLLCDMVLSIAEWFVRDGSVVYDIGCSTGAMLSRLDDHFSSLDIRLVGIERELRFASEYRNTDRIRFCPADLGHGFTFDEASLILSMFTLQFVDSRHHEQHLRRIYSGLVPGGAFILAEKTYAAHSRIQDLLTCSYYDFKGRSFSASDILKKERALGPVMHPKSVDELHAAISSAGFSTYELIWRHFNFIAILCIK